LLRAPSVKESCISGDDHKKRSVLTILLATCEVALQSSRAAEIALDDELVADLERLIERTRAELDAQVEPRLDWMPRP